MLYACDGRWWDETPDAALFKGLKFTQDKNAARAYGLRYVPAVITGHDAGRGIGFCTTPPRIHTGANSGYQAMNLVGHFCGWVGKVVLLGFDMGAPGGLTHWHGNHPDTLNNPNFHNYQAWLRNFAEVPGSIKGTGLTIINASRSTALECFPRVDLEGVI